MEKAMCMECGFEGTKKDLFMKWMSEEGHWEVFCRDKVACQHRYEAGLNFCFHCNDEIHPDKSFCSTSCEQHYQTSVAESTPANCECGRPIGYVEYQNHGCCDWCFYIGEIEEEHIPDTDNTWEV